VFIDQAVLRGESWESDGGGYRPVVQGMYVVRAQTVDS
jgi:hypothetical protein